MTLRKLRGVRMLEQSTLLLLRKTSLCRYYRQQIVVLHMPECRYMQPSSLIGFGLLAGIADISCRIFLYLPPQEVRNVYGLSIARVCSVCLDLQQRRADCCTPWRGHLRWNTMTPPLHWLQACFLFFPL